MAMTGGVERQSGPSSPTPVFPAFMTRTLRQQSASQSFPAPEGLISAYYSKPSGAARAALALSLPRHVLLRFITDFFSYTPPSQTRPPACHLNKPTPNLNKISTKIFAITWQRGCRRTLFKVQCRLSKSGKLLTLVLCA